MNILYFDCAAGAAGDMLLTSMLDLGLAEQDLLAQLKNIPLEDYRASFGRVRRGGIQALQMNMELLAPQPLRHYAEVESLIKSASFPRSVQEKSLAVFQALARAEARVHGISEEKVHFHEVGAVDSILDVVGCMLALEQLDVQEVRASPLPLGKGWVETAHGRLPLPAPATAEILKDFQIPCYGVEVEGETVTPSGAAILAVICADFTLLPPLRLQRIGYGAGQRNFEHPNLVRALQGKLEPGEAAGKGPEEEHLFLTEYAEVLEASIDDLNPELYEHVMNCLLEAGALDVFLTPIQMKKNRPAIKLTVLARPAITHKLGQIILRETTTLGYRRSPVEKIMLPREEKSVQTPWGVVRVKLAGRAPHYWNAKPEYQDCLQIAQRYQLPLKDVYRAVWRQLEVQPPAEGGSGSAFFSP